MRPSPDFIFTCITIAALLALPYAGFRAFYNWAHRRFTWVVVAVLFAASIVAPFLGIRGLDSASAATIVAVAALCYTLVRGVANEPERREWLAESIVDPLVLAPLFEGRWRVAAGGTSRGRNHHLIASDQRFAYDLVRRDGPSLGSRIFAPIAGRVVSASDGQPDHAASRGVIEDDAPLGNHVVIDSGRGAVFLCHLQNGSVLVREGDSVDIGVEIGRCGNSGRTSGPHLHVSRARSPILCLQSCARNSNSIPLVIEST